jgi:hypothetical protein
VVERGYARTMRRASALLPAVVAGLAGLCCALLLLGDTRQRTVLMASAAPDARQVAAGITQELFGSRHQRLLRAMGTVRPAAAAPRAFPVRAGTMLEDEEEPKAAEGDLQDDEYARFVWRKERLEKEGVNVDTWLDPGLLDSIDFRDRPYTAGHHLADENITNTTKQFFADSWPQANETTNATWIDDEDFRWNSPADYLGKRPLEVDHHHVVDHHFVKFLPGVNINSNPLCGQNLDGSPIDCGDSEWNVR